MIFSWYIVRLLISKAGAKIRKIIGLHKFCVYFYVNYCEKINICCVVLGLWRGGDRA